jgi:hypothetical protein
MSDEQQFNEETEVEGHSRSTHVSIEPEAEENDEVEAHVRKANARMDSPRHI